MLNMIIDFFKTPEVLAMLISLIGGGVLYKVTNGFFLNEK